MPTASSSYGAWHKTRYERRKARGVKLGKSKKTRSVCTKSRLVACGCGQRERNTWRARGVSAIRGLERAQRERNLEVLRARSAL